MKKIISTILICSFAFALLAGCDGLTETDSTTTTASTAAATTTTKEDSTEEETEASENTEEATDPQETETEAQTEAPEELYEFTMFVNFGGTEMGAGDLAFFEEVEKANNVKIEFELPPASNYAERLQIMLAGDSYPELILFPNEKEKVLFDGVDTGVIIPLDEYLADAPSLKEYSYDISFDSLKLNSEDDLIYGIPRTSIARADGYFLRKDWLDKVGITVEEGSNLTIDEFTNILRAFSQDDPDGNGQNDTYGYAATSGAEGQMDPILSWPFGLIGWQESDGTYDYMDLKYSREHDNYKNALAYTAQLWEEGLIDPDWPVTNSALALERYGQGITGVLNGFAGHYQNRMNEVTSVNPDADLVYITGVQDENGEVKGGSYGTGLWGLWAITKSAEQPGRIVDTLEWIISDEGWETALYGLEGVSFELDGDTRVFNEEQLVTRSRSILRRNNDPAIHISLTTPADEIPKINDLIAKCIDQSVFSMDHGYRAEAVENPEFIDFQKTLDQTIAKIIVGEFPVSEYDNVLDEWYEAGGEAWVVEMNEYIKANQGN